ncbi:MAG: DUF368 domain-containing protein [Bacilli bacterium]
MSFFSLILIGIVIGAGMIIPGVSGAVLAVILDVYDKGVNALNSLIKDFKKNALFLFPLGIGITLGAIWFGKIIIFLFDNHQVETKYAFIGLILGGIPFLIKEIREKTGKSISFFYFFLALIMSVFLWYVTTYIISIDFSKNINNDFICNIKMFTSGIIYSIGKIIPGISGSFLLIIIGLYEYILNIVAHPFSITLLEALSIIPFVLGLFFGVIVLLKVTNYLLKNKFRSTYSAIIGFIIGSIPAINPVFMFNKKMIISVIILMFSFFLSYKSSYK